MSSPTKTKAGFLELALKSGLVTQSQIDEIFGTNVPSDPNSAANQLLKSGIITQYQAKQLLAGKFRGYFLGTYKILQPIGQGGMGSVFLAEHTSLQRRVAIKVLTAEKAKDKLTLERFNREARAAAALDHANIVRLHDISQGNGVHFLVMEYVEGNDLHSLMSKTGPLHYAQAVQYIAQAAAGLQHAHDRGFIHRDIKPANLMLNKDGHIKILDMGLARNFNSSSDNLTALLAEGNIAGTVDFLSPEQAMNHPLDERSDIYSLGATFYALLTGHPPFNGSTAQKLMQHQLKDPPSVMKKLNGRLPPPLSEVLNRMMAKKPSERFQSATDVIDALAPWLPARTTGDIIQDGQPSGAMNYSPSTRNVMKSKSRNKSKSKVLLADGSPLPLWQRKPVIIGAGVLVLAIIGGLCALLFSGPKTPENAKNNTPPPYTPNNNGKGQPSTNNPPPQNAGPVVRPVPAGWTSVYKTDFKDVPTERKLTNFKEAFGGSNIRLFAPGWQYEVYDKNSEGEYFSDLENGVRFIAIGARGGEVASQFSFLPSRDTQLVLKFGVQYELRFEYLLDDKSSASVSVQKVEPYNTLKSTPLSATTAWKSASLAFTMPDEGKVQICFRPNSISTNNFLKIRAVELLEKRTVTTDGKPIIAYQANTLKPSVSSESTGAIESGWDGWYRNTYEKDVQGRYVAKDLGDGMALGVAVESGPKNAAQYCYRPTKTQAALIVDDVSYSASITYRTEPGCSGFASVQTLNDWKMLHQVQLPDTNGTWKKATIPYLRPAGKEIQLAVGPTKADNKFLWIRSLEISVATEAAPPTAPATPKIDKPLGKKLVTLELTAGEEQRAKFQDGSYLGGGINLPDGISTYCWKKESVAEFRTGTIEGSPAVGSVNLNDDLSSQIRFALKPELVKTGRKYMARIEYLTKNEATANLVTQFGKDYKRGAFTSLPMTNDKWATATLRFDCLNTEEAGLLIENQSVGEGTLVYIRKVEVFEDE
jgi:serine/threonine protein kinase